MNMISDNDKGALVRHILSTIDLNTTQHLERYLSYYPASTIEPIPFSTPRKEEFTLSKLYPLDKAKTNLIEVVFCFIIRPSIEKIRGAATEGKSRW